ncbi:MAG: hypothetical protein H6742_12790 [Alphaproteobacteria bacterium]|nr:hypothetical protein [Alphaproteobacteria bacterium]
METESNQLPAGGSAGVRRRCVHAAGALIALSVALGGSAKAFCDWFSDPWRAVDSTWTEADSGSVARELDLEEVVISYRGDGIMWIEVRGIDDRDITLFPADAE